MLPASLVLAGAGKMGGALLQGWLARGLDPKAAVVVDPHPSAELTALCAARGVALNPPAASLRAPQALVLAVKPQSFAEAAPALEPLAGPDTLVVSILAGKTIGDLAARLPRAQAFARAMPNTPAAVGRGVTGVAASAGTSAAQKAMADSLLSAIGAVVWLDDEKLIDAVTAVSGSGPAYVFHLAECMAAAGEALGLPRDVAAQLARATVEGSGELMFRSPEIAPAQLRKNVTSPGGTTAAALDVLMAKDGLAELMARALAAAHRRAGELAG
jgi:pyrroline-5-carboxylate reductase